MLGFSENDGSILGRQVFLCIPIFRTWGAESIVGVRQTHRYGRRLIRESYEINI